MATSIRMVRRLMFTRNSLELLSPCLQCRLKLNYACSPVVYQRNHATKPSLDIAESPRSHASKPRTDRATPPISHTPTKQSQGKVESPKTQATKQQSPDKVKPPRRSQRYVFHKFVNFITSSSDKLEKRVPKVFRVYRTFKTGVSSFLADTKVYYHVASKLWSGESMTGFTRRELELYRQFSSEIPIVGFVLLVAFAPGGALIFPIAYTFPRFLLSSHFWTPEQAIEFRRKELAKRLKHYDSILDYMYLLSQHIDSDAPRNQVRKAINKLETSVNLTLPEVVALKPLFEGRPYRIESVSIRHLRHLGKSLGLSLRRKKLVKDALLLHYIDLAMLREGLETLSDEELDKACTWRGLNPEGVAPEEKILYLNYWMNISAEMRESSISLLLHLPVLLGYCRSSNRRMMGSRIKHDRQQL